MDQGLSIAISGLNASMAEIDAATQNIANSQTPGYVTESASLAALPGGGTPDVGSGVQVTSIAQANDLLLSANNLQAQGTLSNIGALQQVLTGIQDVFPLGQNSSASTTQSANTSIAGQLSNFWSAWDSIAQDPSSLAPRTQIVDMAQGLATSLNEASTQLGQLATNTASELGSNVGQANSLLAQVASLNQSIVTANSGGSGASSLNDQLQNALGQLASLAGVNVTMQENGTAQVTIGGVTLVQGSTADTLKVQAIPPTSSSSSSSTPSSPPLGVYAYPTPADAANSTDGALVSVTSGTIAGQLTGLNVTIPQYEASLNTVASDLATTVNNQLAQGFSYGGSPPSAGGPLFTATGSSTTTVTASNISVSAVIAGNPQMIAASGSQAQDLGSTLGAGTVSTAETLTVSQPGVATSATLTTTPGESLTAIAAGLNSQFASNGLSVMASVVNSGTQLSLTNIGNPGSTGFMVTSTISSGTSGGTGLGGPTPGTAQAFTGSPIGPNDASNAQAMAELGTVSTGPDLAYQNLVQGIGADTQNANSQLASQTSVASQAQQALQAVSGVNENTQLTDLMQYQASYQASAKVVSVIDQTIQSLLAAV